ncbi:hypothetical protein [Chryseobacterium sp. MDT2-18]|uniref:hypothetical protein n=1 Tax=Chryseobacterium sp. MDT2-18 TaxID=1259136 RepID=UPI0027D8FF4A|nr:hypothetical protein [Chryseobacterium sp. MDT2-18]
MKTLKLLSCTAILIVLLLLSCRPADETEGKEPINLLTQDSESSFDEPKDPPKDVPKDRDNWRMKTNKK